MFITARNAGMGTPSPRISSWNAASRVSQRSSRSARNRGSSPRTVRSETHPARRRRRIVAGLFTAAHLAIESGFREGSGRFGLWILEEFRRAGPCPELADAVKPHRARPGVEPFAERLMSLGGADPAKLEAELRAIGK
jgi:hypothetical protein